MILQKRKRHSPAKRLDSNIARPSTYRRTLETSAANRRKSNTFMSKEFLSFASEPTSRLDLDHWDNTFRRLFRLRRRCEIGFTIYHSWKFLRFLKTTGNGRPGIHWKHHSTFGHQRWPNPHRELSRKSSRELTDCTIV